MVNVTPVRIGGYLLERRLGAGRLGETWLARREAAGQATLRRLHPFLTEELSRALRFLDEVQPLRQLEHSNLVRLLACGREGETVYLASEFVDGLTLGACLKANGAPLPPALAAELIGQACEALAYAHRVRGTGGAPLHLVHSGVSPDSLMLDASGSVRVCDFGLARATALLASSRVDVRPGKLLWAAPEYLRDGTLDERVDVYGLGMTLYALCTGRPPLAEIKEPVDLVQRLCGEGVPPPETVVPDLPAELCAIVRDATCVRPERRTASAGELAGRIDTFLATHAPPAPPRLAHALRLWRDRGSGPAPAEIIRRDVMPVPKVIVSRDL